MTPIKENSPLKHSQLRVSYSNKIISTPISSSVDSYIFLKKIWDKKLISIQEQVYILYLNDCNEVICWRCLNTGTSCSTLFDIKLALACALNCLASNIIIAHNHPSGSLNPSGADMVVTKKLKAAAEFMDIKLLDHIIISRNGYCSFSDKLLLTA
jgi:DNA repair protein RadC